MSSSTGTVTSSRSFGRKMLQRHFHVSPLCPQQPTFGCSAISVAKGHQENYAAQQITANQSTHWLRYYAGAPD